MRMLRKIIDSNYMASPQLRVYAHAAAGPRTRKRLERSEEW